MQSLLELDKAIFTLINNRWSNGFFDAMLPLIRNQYTWFPFYLFLMAFAVVNYKKKAWWWILFAVGTAIISNYISSDLIKGNIYRLRPCNDPAMADALQRPCYGRYGSFFGWIPAQEFQLYFFPCHQPFCMGCFFILYIKTTFRQWLAFAICLGRYYLLFTGVCWGTLSARCNSRRFNWVYFRIFVR